MRLLGQPQIKFVMDSSTLVNLALEWATRYFKTKNIYAYLLPREAGDEPEAHLVALAVEGQSTWQGCEIWLEEGMEPSIYDVGDCLAPDGVEWPFTP